MKLDDLTTIDPLRDSLSGTLVVPFRSAMTSGGQLSLDQGHGEAPSVERATKANHRRAKTRARVEHVFGAQSPMGGMLVRTQ